MGEFHYHLVPGGTVGSNPQPNAVPYDLLSLRPSSLTYNDWMFGSNGGFSITNAADTIKRIVGWRALMPLGSGVQGFACVTMVDTITFGALNGFPHYSPFTAIMNGVVTDPLIAATLGYYFIETDAIIMSVSTGSVGDFSFILAPSFNKIPSGGSGVQDLQGTTGYGLCWSKNLPNDNYHLFISVNEIDFLALIDTGVPALDGNIRVLRVEWGWDQSINKPVIRGIIDGIKVAEILGPLVGQFNTNFRLGAFTQGMFCGIDESNDGNQALNSIDAFFGMSLGVQAARLDEAPVPPPPPEPPPPVLTNCSIIIPVFVDEGAGVIETFTPCSGTGQTPSNGGNGNGNGGGCG